MLTVFLGGRGIYRNSAGQVAVVKDMVGLVPPRDPGVLMSDRADPYTHYYCRFAGDYAVRVAASIIASRGARHFPCAYADQIADLVRRMGRKARRELPSTMGDEELLLAQALVWLSRPDVSGGEKLTAAGIEQYLRDRFSSPHDLAAMAEHFMVSKTSLCRAARRLCGTTIVRLSERMRMAWAKTLLRLGTFNVTEVSLRVGYRDPFYFSRVFKRHAGVSPKKWAMGRHEDSAGAS